jgi:hypothetical protein
MGGSAHAGEFEVRRLRALIPTIIVSHPVVCDQEQSHQDIRG